MSTTQQPRRGAGGTASVEKVDQKLEVIQIPVTDIDRATEFYRRLGWRKDETPSWIVQFTPPGSWCSIQFGGGRTSAAPGSAQGTFLIVDDVEAAHDQLVAAGVEVSDVFHVTDDGPVAGPDPDRRSYFSYATFEDPDGNAWTFQEITTRLPGRVDPATTSYGSTRDVAHALRRAAAAHGEHEKRTGEEDANWPDWYAEYMVREQSGAELPR